ncbi:hypothetical protein [Chryseoglobus sp. 28M-23]|uniref:hypothetical protein n=1 Tax=Chryseoglobus sp. 28M-23 TaxID=2772253 RepID=UPI001745C50C|nr:hypothetical protein [Chryseoglobus sp. 28M-23]QOD93480.1 hypothetical protein IE160_11335 [Chryseoglobus sp. 28M-23]
MAKAKLTDSPVGLNIALDLLEPKATLADFQRTERLVDGLTVEQQVEALAEAAGILAAVIANTAASSSFAAEVIETERRNLYQQRRDAVAEIESLMK